MEGTGDAGDERGRPRPPLAHSFELEMISFCFGNVLALLHSGLQ